MEASCRLYSPLPLSTGKQSRLLSIYGCSGTEKSASIISRARTGGIQTAQLVWCGLSSYCMESSRTVLKGFVVARSVNFAPLNFFGQVVSTTRR